MRRCLVAFVALGLLSQVHVWIVATITSIPCASRPVLYSPTFSADGAAAFRAS